MNIIKSQRNFQGDSIWNDYKFSLFLNSHSIIFNSNIFFKASIHIGYLLSQQNRRRIVHIYFWNWITPRLISPIVRRRKSEMKNKNANFAITKFNSEILVRGCVKKKITQHDHFTFPNFYVFRREDSTQSINSTAIYIYEYTRKRL